MLGVFLAFVAVFISLLFIVTVHRKPVPVNLYPVHRKTNFPVNLYPVHRKTNFPVNLYWDHKYSDSDSDTAANLKRKRKQALSFIRSLPHMVRLMHVG